jgi:hypothetical protein
MGHPIKELLGNAHFHFIAHSREWLRSGWKESKDESNLNEGKGTVLKRDMRTDANEENLHKLVDYGRTSESSKNSAS